MNMNEKIKELAEVVIVLRNHDTAEFGPNDYWDGQLQEKLFALGVKTELSDDGEEMSIIDT